MVEKTGMDFEDLYFNLEKIFGEGTVSIPIIPEFNLDNIVEGSFVLNLPSRPKQEVVKGLIKHYLFGQKAKGNDIKFIVLLPDADTGRYDSPVATGGKAYYDEFPENIDRAIIYCIERNVFDSIYGKALTSVRQPAKS